MLAGHQTHVNRRLRQTALALKLLLWGGMNPPRFAKLFLAALSAIALIACASESPLQSCQPPDVPLADDIRAAVDSLPCVESINVDPSGMPTFMQGELGSGESTQDLAAARASLASSLAKIAPVFRLQAGDLVAKSARTDASGATHVRYQQTQAGMDVLGGTLHIHMDARGVITVVSGAARGGFFDSPAEPNVPMDSAANIARDNTEGSNLVTSEPRLVYVVSAVDDAVYLAWEVEVRGLDPQGGPLHTLVYVGTLSGDVVARRSQFHSAKDRRIYSANNGEALEDLPGTLMLSEGGAPVADVDVMALYENFGKTYDCFSTLFARDSYNAGSPIVASVHFSNNWVGAGWYSEGQQFVFGDGDGVLLSSPAHAFDGVAHEFSHAVIEYTAGLVYEHEPGALNEAMSDILAAACEAHTDGSISADTWKVLEDVATPMTPGDAWRYMDDPTKDGTSKDYYPERGVTGFDDGWVHYNSGIANLAFKLLVTGGTHPRNKTTVDVPALGMEKARHIFYRSLTYMNSHTKFGGARSATEAAAKELYDAAAADAVSKAWEAVGVGPSQAPTTVVGTAVDLSNMPNRYIVITVKLADLPGFSRSELAESDGTFQIGGIPSYAGAITVTAGCFGDATTSSSALTPVPGGNVSAGDLTTPTECGCGGLSAGWVQCPGDNTCMWHEWFCDGDIDCPNGADEVNDGDGNPCP